MSNLLLLNKILVISTAVGIGFLSLWVFLSNRKSKINKFFLLWTIFSLFWIIFGYFANTTQTKNLPLLFMKLRFGAVSIFFIFAYFFSLFFYQKKKSYFILNNFVIISCLIFFFLSIFTNLIIKDGIIKGWGVEVIFGKGIIPFYALLTFLTVLIVMFLVKSYFISSKTERTKIQYFLFGAIIFALMNLIFNVGFPISGTYRYYQIGDFSIIFLFAFVAYAIVKKQLFDIRVVLTQLLVVLIAILLLVNFFISESLFEYVWKGALFVAFVIFGILLVKSVLKEIRQKEELERQKAELDMLATKVAIANIKLEGANAQLKTLDAAKSEFISIASHQLRSPLTAIKGYISMLIEGDYGKMPLKALKPIENVYASSERLIMLVNSLLSISRLESGKITMEYSDVDLAAIVEDVIREMKVEAEKHQLKLQFERPEDKIILKLDKEKIRNVVLNLIDNAIKYTVNGLVEVSLTSDGQNVRLIIQDTGAGLNSEEIERLFESFSRAGAGQRFWVEGVGLGLYIARKFVEMHNGRIWAESEGKGKGSRFIVELPLA